MKLRSWEVTEFKSIQRSNVVRTADITCLVGKNESGKTALLEALYRLNPVVKEHGKFDVGEDYPRSAVEDYRQDVESGRRDPAIVVRATFELDNEDLVEMRERFGQGVLKSNTFTLSKGYEGTLLFRISEDEAAAVSALVAAAQLPAEVADEAAKQPTIEDLSSYLVIRSESQAKAVAAALATANAIADAQEKARATDAAKHLAETEAAKQLRAVTGEILDKDNFGLYLWEKYLRARLPKFLYFDEYYQMKGVVNIQKLRERQQQEKLEPSDYPMLGLIQIARFKLEELLAPERTVDLIGKLEGASNHLSRQVLKYWSQNQHIRLHFDVRPGLTKDPEGLRDGTNLWGYVRDEVHEASTGIGKRSRGFVWFFSFLAWYSQQKQKSQQPLILLLDEPGLFLHASAQADFLRYMEAELQHAHQVIYTTHSPFMIDPTRFDRVRIVEDKSMTSDEPLPVERRGTKVTSDILEVDGATLFPLQGALGYELAQTLFVGPNSLIVEGVSDLLFIEAISGLLQQNGRDGLRLGVQRWVVTPVGGAEKVPTFAALIGRQPGMNVATLIDLQKKGQQSVENLYKRKLLNKTHVHTYADFTKEAEADIEDMFDDGFYIKIVNAEYGKELGKALTLKDLPQGGPRIVPRIEIVFANRGIAGGFNHYRPARYFVENVTKLSPGLSAETLDRFQEAFDALNRLLA